MRGGRGAQHNTCQVVGLIPHSAWPPHSDFPLISEPESHETGAERQAGLLSAWTSLPLKGFPYTGPQGLRETYRPVRGGIPVCSFPGTPKMLEKPNNSPLFPFHFKRLLCPSTFSALSFPQGGLLVLAFSHPIWALPGLAELI